MDRILTTQQLIETIKSYKFVRAISQLHIHHTWRPNHKNYDGTDDSAYALQRSMRTHHIKKNGWSDIAQHLTLLPDGRWITGREFNQDPASIKGWNKGAFAIEMLGDFDTGQDKLNGKQLESIIEFSAFFIPYFVRTLSDIKFHREGPNVTKTCPGSGIDKKWFIGEIKKYLIASEVAKMIYRDEKNIAPWAKNAVKTVSDLGIMKGDGHGDFMPVTPITRQEVAVVVYNLLKYLGELPKD